MTQTATTTAIPDTATKFAAILDAWDARTLTDTNAVDLARLTGEHLSIRDAFLAHLISPDTSRDTIMDMATHPHRPDVAAGMYDILEREFNGGHIDAARLRRTAAAVAGITARVPADIPCTQVEAIAAYLLWWGGDARAATAHAAAALSSDETCSLAALIITAIQRDIMPA